MVSDIKIIKAGLYVRPMDSPGKVIYSLPNIAFWDPDILDLELETIFRNSWILLPKQLLREHNPNVRSLWIRPAPGHSHFDVLGQRGGSVKLRILGESLMIYRGFSPKGAPELRCFANMCPHARYPFLEIAQDADSNPYIKCPQHGLVCDENGQFVSHRAFPNPRDEERKGLSMARYGIEEWFDFLFISRAENPAPSFGDTMRPVFESLRNMPFADFQYRNMGVQQRIVEGNWKLHTQNYEDWLHIKDIHKAPNGLADSMDLSSARMELYDNATLMWGYAANPEDGFDPKVLPDRFRDPKDPENRRVFALWWFVFPNLALNFYPWGLSVNIFMPAMVDTERMKFDPEKTEFLWYHYVWDEEKYKDIESRWLNTLVDFEDIEAIKYIAENLRGHSRPWSRGLFGKLPDGSNTEIGPWWFNLRVYERMFP